jgi:hypothetical protein
MRHVGGSRLIFALCATGVGSLLRQINLIPGVFVNTLSYYSGAFSLSDVHYALDSALRDRYSSTDHKIIGNFSLLLTVEDEEEIRVANGRNGTRDRTKMQHRGVVKISKDKAVSQWNPQRIPPYHQRLKIGNQTGFFVGGEFGNFTDTKLAVHVNDTIFNSKNRLCDILEYITHRDVKLDMHPADHGIKPTVLVVSIDCATVQSVERLGQYIEAMYGVKLATALAGIDVDFHCENSKLDHDLDQDGGNVDVGNINTLQTVLPWLTSHQDAILRNQTWPYSGTPPTYDEVCTDLQVTPWDKMAIQIRHDIRKMAVEVIGSRAESDRRHHLVPLDNTPLIPNVSLDDVIIHFPCEDRSKTNGGVESERHEIGILDFSEYVHWISSDSDSIGIIVEVTNQGEPVEWCKPLSKILLEYLRISFPTANVSIYDDDPITLRFARIAMAKQSFSSMSFVGMIPVIGTFGQGFIQPSKQSGIQQRIHELSNYEGFDNIHILGGNILSPEEMLTQKWYSDLRQ